MLKGMAALSYFFVQSCNAAAAAMQVKISRCQTMVAYTLDHSSGGELYTLYVKHIMSGKTSNLLMLPLVL